MAVLDFFKKDDSHDDQTVQSGNVTAVTTQTTQQGQMPQSYNGIGNPPGGQAYNGIGSPPNGQAFNGIGTPPVAPVQAGQPVSQMPPAAQVPSQTTPATTNADGTPTTPSQPGVTDPTQPPADPNNPLAKDGAAPKTGDPSQPPAPDPLDPNVVGSSIDPDKRTNLDLMTHLTQRSNRVFMSAQQKAKELKSEFIDSEHVLHGLLADPEIYKLFTDEKIPPQTIEAELEKVYLKGAKDGVVPQVSPRLKKILESSLVLARKVGYEFISPEHILLSLYAESEGMGARTLAKLGMKKDTFEKKILGKKHVDEKDEQGNSKSSLTVLEQYTNDLTAKAAAGQLDPVVERSEVIERVIHIISRRTKNNPVLVGEAGVGKTAVVEGLAQKIVKKEVPESLIGKRILQLDLMAIIAGASHRGEFEERMKKIIEEISNAQGAIILFIDEIHNLVGAGAGGEGSLDASNFLKPSLARGELQLIGATTTTEYRKYIEKDPALERRFQPVTTPEPTVEQAIKMVMSLRDKYEAFHKVKIPDEAITAAVNLSKRYVGDRFLPDKAVDLIDEAASAVRLPLISLPEVMRSLEDRIKQLQQDADESEKNGNKVKLSILKPKIEDLIAELDIKKDEYDVKKSQTTAAVSEQSIKDIISRWTGIPISKITESEIDKLKNLESIIHQRLINQSHAVEPVAQSIRRGRAGLKSNERPIGSFVFLGPTGVGKTELAKTLAEVLFGQEEAMIRFDMTEYMEKHEVAKLLGAPPGYVGYEEGGKLTEAVRRRPYAVVLFDEVEKAHPDIFNILLQILDDGRLTDNKGHVVSFKNTVVITTSNIGTKMIQDEIMAGGKVDIEEPTILSTYAFSPRGRQIMTIMGKVFEREGQNAPWDNKILNDYFSGQKVEKASSQVAKKTGSADGADPDGIQDAAAPAPADNGPAIDFPTKEFDTHTMSPKGEEMISSEENLFIKTSTTAKIWTVASLIEYFKDNVVINAIPDAPDEQLPTARLKTHAFSPSEYEYVSYRDRYWKRKAGETNWETGLLKDYFKGQTITETGVADASTATEAAAGSSPTTDPATTSPTGASGDVKSTTPASMSIDSTIPGQATADKTEGTQDNKDNKDDKDASTSSTGDSIAERQKAAAILPKNEKHEPAAFPVNYWDIHTFAPDGAETIIVGETVWTHKPDTTNWEQGTLSTFFGPDFPLEKEMDEKKAIENELAKTQYDRIKVKVMDELRKFFRPELINRFDEVIIFEPLKYEHMLLIAELQMKGLKKLLEDQGMGFSWTEPAKKEIVRQGFDPLYGARPLKRTIQKLVENPISSLIIEQKVKEGDLVNVDFDGENFIFNVEKVVMMSPDELAKKKMRSFRCVDNLHEFETEVKETATTICPVDASSKVEEIVKEDKVEDKAKDADPITDEAADATKDAANGSPTTPAATDMTDAATPDITMPDVPPAKDAATPPAPPTPTPTPTPVPEKPADSNAPSQPAPLPN